MSGLTQLTLTEDYPFPDVPPGKCHITHGVKLGPGETPGIRQELRDLKEDKDLWNLYLLGLFQWHRVPQDRHYSWMKIGGIHGFPYQPWPPSDDSIVKMKNNPNDNATFCTHTSVLFLSWHRPYLALYEEVLHKIIQIVAAKFTPEEGRARYMKAAKTFRIPYWDWARQDRPTFPDEAVVSDRVTVTMPAAMRKEHGFTGDSAQVEVHNPLYSYQWHDDTPEPFKIHGKKTTVRYDNLADEDPEEDGASPEEVQKRIAGKLKPYDTGTISQESGHDIKVEGNLTERVVLLLQSYDRFYNFTSNRYAGPDKEVKPVVNDDHSITVNGGGYGSLEDIHNTLHELAGGTGTGMDGHMAQVERSSFDPIFWLHHANVDRMFNMWQALHDRPDNPYSYITPQIATNDFGGNWVVGVGGEQNVNTPLVPFYKSEGKFWDSNGVKYSKDLGYTYPETQEWKFKGDKEAYRKHVRAHIARLYSSGSLATMIAKKKITGSHEDEDRIYDRAKLWLSVMQSELKSTAVNMIQMAKQVTPKAAKPAGNQLPTSMFGMASSTASGAGRSLMSLADLLPKPTPPKTDIHGHRGLETLAEPDGIYYEWMLNVVAEKHALGGRYTVHVFLGSVQETDPHLFSISPNHVGTFSPLGQGEETGCEKCQVDQADHQKITGQIPLTIALVERYFAEQLDNLHFSKVIPYLQKNLHWEVVDHKGDRLETGRNAVAGLQVAVVSNKVKIPTTLDDLPEYSEQSKLWPQATTLPNGQGRAEGTGTTLSNIRNFMS